MQSIASFMDDETICLTAFTWENDLLPIVNDAGIVLKIYEVE